MKKKERTLLVINWQDIRHPLAGGAEVHCHEIFRRLAARGHTVLQLSCAFPGAPNREMNDGILIRRAGTRNLFNYVVPRRSRELCREFPVDLVIEDINKIPFFTPIYLRRPILALAHHLFGRAIYHAVSPHYGTYVLTAEQLIPMIYRNTPFAAVSESTRSELKRIGIRGSVDLMPNGNDLPDLDELNPPDDPPVIGYFGRVERYKRIDHLLAALPGIRAAVPGTVLRIIGDGFHRGRLEECVRRMGLEKAVTFTGRIAEADKWKEISRLFLGVCPSAKEGWGLSVMELAACGVPVVASDVPGLRETVRHDETGLLYPFGDIEVLTRQVVSLLESSERRNQMGRQARAWASGRSWDATADIAEDLIERTIMNAEKG
jgi:glycosyltransferase involved in cell wall biosynthesis